MATFTKTYSGHVILGSNIYVPSSILADGTYDITLKGGSGNDTLFAYAGPANWVASNTANPAESLTVTTLAVVRRRMIWNSRPNF